jgi:hypothetical protein
MKRIHKILIILLAALAIGCGDSKKRIQSEVVTPLESLTQILGELAKEGFDDKSEDEIFGITQKLRLHNTDIFYNSTYWLHEANTLDKKKINPVIVKEGDRLLSAYKAQVYHQVFQMALDIENGNLDEAVLTAQEIEPKLSRELLPQLRVVILRLKKD